MSVPRDRPHLSRGEAPAGPRQTPSAASSTKLILATVALVLLVLGALLTALTGNWWFMGLALILDALGAAATIAMVLQMTGTREHADATTVAM